MTETIAAPGLPPVTVRLDAAGAVVMTEPAIRVDRRPTEETSNFKKRLMRLAKKRGFSVGAFEMANGSSIPNAAAPEGGDEGSRRLQVIYLHGKDQLGRALGPNDFRLEREPGEAEESFRARAMQAAAAKRLPWLAFEKPCLAPAHDEVEAR